MAVLTGQESQQIAPNAGVKVINVQISTADSADTIDVSSETVTGEQIVNTIYNTICHDLTTGDEVTATFSGTVVTIDAAGGTTDHDYSLVVFGV